MCRSKQIFGVPRIFARISRNLPEKLFCDLCLQIFSNEDHEDLFWCDLQKKVFICYCANVGRHFAKIFMDFSQIFRYFAQISRIFPGFLTNQNFGGLLAPPPPTLLVNILAIDPN